jgi:fructoselysine-6-phosphate deglycase
MLNFDEKRFVEIQNSAARTAGQLSTLLGSLVSAGSTNLFFLGTGGAGFLMEPAARLLQSSSVFPTFIERPAELLETGSVHLGPTSLVIIPSRSGNTKESVQALSYCQDRGATVITLTAHGDTPLARTADHNLTTFADDDTSSESFYVQSLAGALGVMQSVDGYDASAFFNALPNFAEMLLNVKRQEEPLAQEKAEYLSRYPFHVITGAGSTWPEAHYYGMCILEEMQWILTRPVHASDFFHGTLELIEASSSVVIFKGEDASRPLTERLEAFVRTLTEHVLVLDAATYDLPGVRAAARALLSPIFLATALERISAHLEVIRDHPLTTRRYYRQIEY